MNKTNTNSHRAFKYSSIAFTLSVFGILIITVFKSNPHISSIFSGLLFLAVGIIAIIALINALKGLREPNTLKKIIGFILSLAFVILFISAIVANILDMNKALNQ